MRRMKRWRQDGRSSRAKKRHFDEIASVNFYPCITIDEICDILDREEFWTDEDRAAALVSYKHKQIRRLYRMGGGITGDDGITREWGNFARTDPVSGKVQRHFDCFDTMAEEDFERVIEEVAKSYRYDKSKLVRLLDKFEGRFGSGRRRAFQGRLALDFDPDDEED